MTTPGSVTKPQPHPKYRPDIDGLRAVAVLAVVCFHAFPNVFAGGFIGVDIFFIISGFLISGILLSSLKKRRIRFQRVLHPAHLTHFPGADCHSHCLLFHRQHGFIAERVSACSIASSFAVNIYTVQTDAVQSFYSPITRFWELLLGGLLAYFQQHMIHVEQRIRHTIDSLLSRFTPRRLPVVYPITLQSSLSILGILCIVLAILFIDKKKLFPGWWALLPALGTYLIISAGPLSVVNRHVLS